LSLLQSTMQLQYPSQFPTLATQRLILRMLRMDDAPEIFKLRSDDRVNQYLDRPKALSIDEAIEFINKIENGIKNKEWFYWAISLKNDHKLTGTICLWNIDKENSRIEVGYELHPDFQGKGLMQEAFFKIIYYGLNTLEFKTVAAYLNPTNERSIRLLEKNNFRRDTALEDEYYKNEPSAKEVIYSLKSPLN
jgi:ribosomal-protein-alanine N-acetyltransferase